jgi:hypothetical protein
MKTFIESIKNYFISPKTGDTPVAESVINTKTEATKKKPKAAANTEVVPTFTLDTVTITADRIEKSDKPATKK